MEHIVLRLVGDWAVEVRVSRGGGQEVRGIITVPAPVTAKIQDESYAELPEYNAGSWAKWLLGIPLNGVKAQECTSCYSLVPESLKVVPAEDPASIVYVKGQDYDLEQDWGSLWRLPQGRIQAGQPVLVSYEYLEQRLDSIILDAAGQLGFRRGTPHIATPLPPALSASEIRVANIFIERKVDKLTEDNLYPVLETAYPGPPRPVPSVAERLLPETMKRLNGHGKLKILAWGDSVTDGGFLADKQRDGWQVQFLGRIKEHFPRANIELVTEAWPGRTTAQYLAEPPGAEHNYQEKVLAVKPDLVIMEFVNDAGGLHGEALEAQYGQLLNDIRGMGAEWIIITPHYIRGDWMGLTRQKDIDDDPRFYVKSLREFAAKHQVPLAEGSLRYGRLWRQGIPYNTLMQNNINHPDARGMKLFADSLMELFC